jgi:hypothetical protein
MGLRSSVKGGEFGFQNLRPGAWVYFFILVISLRL